MVLMLSIILFNVTKLREVEDASGNSKVMNKRPSSSVGINPVGFALKRKNVPTKMQSNIINASADFFMIHFTDRVYLSVSLVNQLLNLKKNLFKPFDLLSKCEGFNINV